MRGVHVLPLYVCARAPSCIQMMAINGRQQPVVLMTVAQAQAWQRHQLLRAQVISAGGNCQLAAQMEQQQSHMQQLLAAAKPDTVFAIPMSAAAAGNASPGPSTAASSVATSMMSVGANRPPPDPASASSSSSGISVSSSSLLSGVTPGDPLLPTTATFNQAAAAVANATANAIAAAAAQATVAAAQATAAAAAQATTVTAGHVEGATKRPSLDSSAEPAARKKKTVKAAVDALPKYVLVVCVCLVKMVE